MDEGNNNVIAVIGIGTIIITYNCYNLPSQKFFLICYFS